MNPDQLGSRPVTVQLSGDQLARCGHIHRATSRARRRGWASVQGAKKGIVPGSSIPVDEHDQDGKVVLA
jgi:hypothetical protein